MEMEVVILAKQTGKQIMKKLVIFMTGLALLTAGCSGSHDNNNESASNPSGGSTSAEEFSYPMPGSPELTFMNETLGEHLKDCLLMMSTKNGPGLKSKTWAGRP
jgi:hypothetical protein